MSIRRASTREPSRATRTSSSTASPLTSRSVPANRCPELCTVPVNTIGSPPRGTVARVDLDAYVAEHAGEWRRLEYLSRRRKLSAAEADELIALYQRAATHLSVIRSRSPDPAL